MAGDELIVQQTLTAWSLLLTEGYKAEKDLDSSSSLGECSGRGEQGSEGSEGSDLSQVWGGEEDPCCARSACEPGPCAQAVLSVPLPLYSASSAVVTQMSFPLIMNAVIVGVFGNQIRKACDRGAFWKMKIAIVG